MVPIVCLLSDYLANSLIVDLDRRFVPPRPTNPGESFLIVTLCSLFFRCSNKYSHDGRPNRNGNHNILLGLPFRVYIISYLLFHYILCILLIYPAI